MASMITFFENKQKQQVQDLKQALYLELYAISDFKEFHTVIPNVVHNSQVLFLGDLSEPVGQTRTVGACAMPTGIGTISTSEKVWLPVQWGEKRGFCADEWQPYISQYALEVGIDVFNMTDTDMMDIIIDRIAKKIVEAHWTKAWFGDKNATAFDGSPAGELIHAKYVPFFNTIDGYFAQMADYIALGGANADQQVTIAGNAEATFAAQKAWGITASTVADVDGNKCLEVAYNIEFATPTFIKQMAGQTAYCTRLFYNCLRRNFVGKDLESMFVNLQNGKQGLQVFGTTYIPIDIWDFVITNYLQNGTKYFDPYRVVVTPKDNLQYATTSGSELGLNDVRTWYNIDENKTYLQFADQTDAKLVMDNKFILAI